MNNSESRTNKPLTKNYLFEDIEAFLESVRQTNPQENPDPETEYEIALQLFQNGEIGYLEFLHALQNKIKSQSEKIESKRFC